MLALLLLSSYHQASTISFKTKSSAQCNILIKKKHLGQEGFATRLKIQSQKARVQDLTLQTILKWIGLDNCGRFAQNLEV